MPPALLPLKALRVAEEMPQKCVRDGAKWMVYDGTVKRQSRLSFHVFVAVPMGRAFFRCRLF